MLEIKIEHNPSSCPFEKGYPIIIRTKLEREYCKLVLVLRKTYPSKGAKYTKQQKIKINFKLKQQ